MAGLCVGGISIQPGDLPHTPRKDNYADDYAGYYVIADSLCGLMHNAGNLIDETSKRIQSGGYTILVNKIVKSFFTYL